MIHLDYSISRYVGQTWWSATMFAMAIFMMIWVFGRKIKSFGARKEMGARWKFWSVILLAGALGVAFFPIGLFDAEWGEMGWVSILHQVFSRTMFVAMSGMVLEMALVDQSKRRDAYFLFVAYGMMLAAMSFTTQVFWDYTLIFESTYLGGFMLMLALSQDE